MECLLVKLVNNICITWSIFPARVGKGWLFYSIVFIQRFWLVLQYALCGVIRQLYTHCFCLFGSFPSFCLNHQFGIQSNEICTPLPNRIAYAFKWSYGIFDTEKHLGCWFRPWYLDARCLPHNINPACGSCQHPVPWVRGLGRCVSVKPIMPP